MHFTTIATIALVGIGSATALPFIYPERVVLPHERNITLHANPPIPTHPPPGPIRPCIPSMTDDKDCTHETYNHHVGPFRTLTTTFETVTRRTPVIEGIEVTAVSAVAAPSLRPACTTWMPRPFKTFDYGPTMTIYENTVVETVTVDCGGCAVTFDPFGGEMGPGPVRRISATVTEVASTSTATVCAGPTSMA